MTNPSPAHGGQPGSAERPPTGGAPAEAAPADGDTRRTPIGEYVFAILTTLTGIGMIAGAFSIPIPRSPEPLGPRSVPIAIGVALTAVSLWILVRLARGVQGKAEDSEDVDLGARTDWGVVAIIAGLVLVHAALIEPAGWPIAAMVLFVGAGFVLGARPWWKPVVIGIVLALVLQFVFAYLLGVSLPAGPLERVVFLHG